MSRIALLLISICLGFSVSLFSDLNYSLTLVVILFIFIFLKLINDLGRTIPIKELMSFIVLLQFFISPLIVYRYFENRAHFKMYVDEKIYMLYVIPAIVCFIIGLNLKLRKSDSFSPKTFLRLGECINTNTINAAYLLLMLGFVGTYLNNLFPSSFAFILYLFSLLKFIGVFILYFSKSRYRILILLIVFGQFTIEIINGGVFYDLFVWAFFLYMLMESKWKSSLFRKLVFIAIGFSSVYLIQSIKGEYRAEVWENQKQKDNTGIFIDIVSDKVVSDESLSEETDLDRFISRLNTGWIVSKVIEHTPLKEPFTNGETIKQDLINVFLPRFLFPNKAETGGTENQAKFTKFTGRRLIGSTTMRIGAISDAYINFGLIGGCIIMLLLGVFFNITLSFIVKMSKRNPIYILWIPFVFAYAIRMSDIQVILNYTFKSLLFVIIINSMIFRNLRSG